MRRDSNKLNADELDILKELTDHSEKWKALMHAMSIALEDMARRVLDYNLANGPEKLALEKARYEGAKDLKQAIEALKSKGSRG